VINLYFAAGLRVTRSRSTQHIFFVFQITALLAARVHSKVTYLCKLSGIYALAAEQNSKSFEAGKLVYAS